MSGIKKLLEEKNIHLLFEISLIGKGIIALFEIIGGILVYFISQQFLLELVLAITQDELTEDPRDFISYNLLHSAQSLSIGSQHFLAFFLLSHGVIKMFLITGLIREKLSYYPSGMIVFLLFILYQLYRFNFTHSFWLLLITAMDVLIIGLIWHEYNYLRKKRN
ncbi:DUF2127 domain-containing protein [Candidatus Kaiserbacteria bacterium]|nr:DUF2127 domain-containing protein [Candidatus Kaiserbacteria bacterium]